MEISNEVLYAINPSSLEYGDWLRVGMALKHEGYGMDVWERWSMQDSARYRAEEFQRKWDGFGGSDDPVTGATILALAKKSGWNRSGALEWDDIIGDPPVILDRDGIEGDELPDPPPPSMFSLCDQLSWYVERLFKPGEYVGYVVRFIQDEGGKWRPANAGRYNQTREELLNELRRHRNSPNEVIGDITEDENGNPVGALIRFNPLDGSGAKDTNVTSFRYALVECDTIDIREQYARIKALQLPVKVLVHSGNKSLHAIVKVEASNLQEYKERVKTLYAICQENGLKLDSQNSNPSRMSRMPGVYRLGKPQYIVADEMGKKDWHSWMEFIDEMNDGTPPVTKLSDCWSVAPVLAPPLIDGVLRRGHKMLVSGPSKAGKSFALIELCCAIAEGTPWLGYNVHQGRVLYVNLELDEESCKARFHEVYRAMGTAEPSTDNIDIWNLRGRAEPMDRLAPKLIRKARPGGYAAIIIDPIYKVLTGDENSADQMAAFCNNFDKVCAELGCSLIYCHHHSKGAQGGKRTMDRASGSGVFARDPDALLDLLELEIPEELRNLYQEQAARNIYIRKLKSAGMMPANGAGSEELYSMILDCCSEDAVQDVDSEVNEAQRAIQCWSAYRIDGNVREFAPLLPKEVWFRYPLHVETDELRDAEPVEGAYKRRTSPKRNAAKQSKQEVMEKFRAEFPDVFERLSKGGSSAATADVMRELNIRDPRTLAKRLKELGGWIMTKERSADGLVVRL